MILLSEAAVAEFVVLMRSQRAVMRFCIVQARVRASETAWK